MLASSLKPEERILFVEAVARTPKLPIVGFLSDTFIPSSI
jgi:hypothetical protein